MKTVLSAKARNGSSVLDRGPYSILECGVDWLTVTCRSDGRQDEFDDAGHRLLFWERSNAEKFSPWRFMQFEGFRCGGVAFGKSGDLSIMRLSSKLAWSNWQRVYELSTNCSRLDVQVTINGVSDARRFIRDLHRCASEHVAGMVRPPQIDLRLSNRSSPTVYFNQRTSSRFARIYDKHDESGLDHYKGAVRFEVQFNDSAARSTSFTLAGCSKPATGSAALVAGFFVTRGIAPLWSAEDLLTSCSPRTRTHADRSLEWMRRQVRPCVQNLIESGRLADAVEALGLSEFLVERVVGPTGPTTPMEEQCHFSKDVH